jgi:branched-chain amino acid transport system permease protein
MAGPVKAAGGVSSRDTPMPIGEALQVAGYSAAVAFLLAIPMLAWQTTEGSNQQLALRTRWPLVAAAVGVVFVLRLMAALAAGRTGGLAEGMQGVTRSAVGAGRFLGPAALAFAVALPFLPFSDRYIMEGIAIPVLTYIMLGWGLNIVVGLAGLLDLGYVAFYAVGAYSYALLAQHFGLSFWICLPLAGVLAAFWGILLGFPVLRLRGDYLAIVTLAFGEIIRILLINWTALTGGPNGLSGIPRPTLFGLEFKNDCGPGAGTFCSFFGLEFSPLHRIVFLYYIILALALLTNWVTMKLRRLPVGRAWEALREDEIACRSLGINTTTTKLTAFAIGAAFGGFAGAFFATRQAFISPESFTFWESAIILAIVVLGGMGSQIGVAISAFVMTAGLEAFRNLGFLKAVFGEGFDPTQYRMLIFGAAMVIMMRWKPRGFVGNRTPSIALKERRAISGDLVKEGHG